MYKKIGNASDFKRIVVLSRFFVTKKLLDFRSAIVINFGQRPRKQTNIIYDQKVCGGGWGSEFGQGLVVLNK